MVFCVCVCARAQSLPNPCIHPSIRSIHVGSAEFKLSSSPISIGDVPNGAIPPSSSLLSSAKMGRDPPAASLAMGHAISRVTSDSQIPLQKMSEVSQVVNMDGYSYDILYIYIYIILSISYYIILL